ncbi:hypothetical protein ES703_63758 [subsurface metagenome]
MYEAMRSFGVTTREAARAMNELSNVCRDMVMDLKTKGEETDWEVRRKKYESERSH